MVKRGNLAKVLHSGKTSTGHAHAVSFYARDEDVAAEVAAYVEDGLLDGQHVLIVTAAARRAVLDGQLIAVGVDPWAERAQGRYTCLDAASTLAEFMRDGRPNPHRFAACVGGLIDAVGEDGSPVRVFGEMVALLWEAGNVSAALELEDLWNALADTRTFTLLCAYPASVLGTSRLTDIDLVCGLHSQVSPPGGARTVGARRPASPTLDQRSEVFLPIPEAPAAARRFAAAVLGDWGCSQLSADVMLVVSELATNAVCHARSPFLVFFHYQPDGELLVGVKDVAPQPPALRAPTGQEPHGRGLLLVDKLSQRWGCDALPDGKMVWAEFSIAG